MWDHRNKRPLPTRCWLYDIRKARPRLTPFNYCDVVRIRFSKTHLYGIPIGVIPRKAIMGLLVKSKGYNHNILSNLLTEKGWDENENFEVFPIL